MLAKYPVSATLPFHGLKKAQAFYADKLGLELVDGSVEDGYLHFAAGEGTLLQVFESESGKSDDTAATFVVEDLASVMRDLKKKGVAFEDYDLPGIKTVNGVATMGDDKAAWVKDPGGNIIGLHQPG